MGEFRMPSLGADMEVGTITEWRVAPGDSVRRGDIVAVVDTEKSEIEIEIFESGVIGDILVPIGREVPVGTTIATVLAAGAAPVPPRAPVAAPAVPVTPAAPAPVPSRPAVARAPQVQSPLVRHLAEELGVDVTTVKPSGPGGRVTRRDVEAAAARARPPGEPEVTGRPPERVRATPYARKRAAELGVELAGVAAAHPGETIRVGLVERFAATAAPAARPPAAARAEARGPGLQRAVGRLMERSKREIPHYYLAEDIDMGRALAWMEACNTARSVKERLLPAALLLRAVVLATSEVPEVNGTYVDGVFHHTDAVHLGIAVSQRRGGLIAPVIRDAHTLSLHRLMALMLEVVGRARSGALRSSDVDSATITVTNLGDQGVDGVWGVIIPPQVAIVGFGRIRERPWAEHGMLAARPVVTASLSGDHRVSHGHRGARFLGAVARALENPEVLA